MNDPWKTFLRITGVVVGLGAAAWALRDKLLPAPAVPEGPPPKFRTAPSKPSAPTGPADLTEVKGIGPVYAERLVAAGFDTIAALAGGDAEAIGNAAGVSADTAKKWVKAASDL
jgi:predicted flap endonuclease-1-like 5' DNA nuclease